MNEISDLLSRLAVCILVVGALAWSAAAEADDRHAGYYYPEPQTTEVYVARAEPDPAADRARRIGVIVEMTAGLLSRPHAPDYAIFVKGADAEKVIIVALRDDVIDTLYRGRALLAQLTAIARNTPLFKDMGVEDYFTFFDLLHLVGFEQLTISDGESYAHQVTFE